MPNRVESLTLRKFRGATKPVEIRFDVDKPMAMIFGENGAGKSTIVDGLDFVCNEGLGSLEEERSIPGSKAKYMASLGESEADLEVSLKYNGQTWIGSIGSGKRPSSRGPQHRPRAHILRRRQVLKIIDSPPKERYEAIKQYIDVPYCDKNEETLREAVKNNKKNYEFSTAALNQSRSALEELWKAENQPGPGFMAWAETKLKPDHQGLKANIDKIDSLLNLYSACGEKYKEYQRLEERQKDDEKRRDAAKEAFFKYQLQAVKTAGELIDVLKTAQTYFEKNKETQACPVCENKIEAAKVSERIKERLAAMAEQVRLKEDYEKAQNQVEKIINLVTSTQEQFIVKARELVKYVDREKIFGTGLLRNCLENRAAIGRNFTSVSFLQKLTDDNKTRQWDGPLRVGLPAPFWEKLPGEDFKSLSFTDAISVCKDLKPYKEELEQKKEEMNKTYHQWNAIRNHLDTIKENDKLCRRLEKKIARLEEILRLLERERKSFVETVLAEISGVVEEIYLKVHPEEGIGSITFYLKPKTIGSLEFTGRFQNHDEIVTQAYYSESHLDTLGICIFLALARYYRDEDTVIVMDDVLTSVDQAHMERFSKMLVEEAAYFSQVIVTTHFRDWRERYGREATAGIQLVELLPWSITTGIRVMNKDDEGTDSKIQKQF